MEQTITRNALIGHTTVETLTNLSAIMMLLKDLNFHGDIEPDCEHGLYVLHSLVKESLEYEIERLREQA